MAEQRYLDLLDALRSDEDLNHLVQIPDDPRLVSLLVNCIPQHHSTVREMFNELKMQLISTTEFHQRVRPFMFSNSMQQQAYSQSPIVTPPQLLQPHQIQHEPIPNQPNQPNSNTRKRSSEKEVSSKKQKTSQLALPSQDDSADTTDIEKLLDTTSYMGFNIEEEDDPVSREFEAQAALCDNGYIAGQDRVKCQDFMIQDVLSANVDKIANNLDINNVDQDAVTYIALSIQELTKNLLTSMIKASNHRTGIKHQEFVDDLSETSSSINISITANPRKEAAAIEKAERDAERSLRASLGYGGIIGEDGASEILFTDEVGKKKKKNTKKSDVPEAVKTRLVNQAALKAAGGSMKSWMLPNSGFVEDPTLIVPEKKKKKDKVVASMSVNFMSSQQAVETPVLVASNGERIMRPMIQRDTRRITLIDALVSMEKDGYSKTQKGLLCKWWMNLK